jgi:hypothetical protein
MSSNVQQITVVQAAQKRAIASQVWLLRTKVNELSKVVEEQAVQLKSLRVETQDQASSTLDTVTTTDPLEFGRNIGKAVRFVARLFGAIIVISLKVFGYIATIVIKTVFEEEKRPQAANKTGKPYAPRNQAPKNIQNRQVVQCPPKPSQNARWVWFGKWIE